MDKVVAFLLGNWRTIGAILAILGAVWFLDHRGYQRAREEQRALDAREAIRLSEMRRAIEQGLTVDMQGIEDRLASRLRSIAETRSATQTIIEREVSRAPNLSSPQCTMPVSVRDALNSAARPGDSRTPGGRP